MPTSDPFRPPKRGPSDRRRRRSNHAARNRRSPSGIRLAARETVCYLAAVLSGPAPSGCRPPFGEAIPWRRRSPSRWPRARSTAAAAETSGSSCNDDDNARADRPGDRDRRPGPRPGAACRRRDAGLRGHDSVPRPDRTRACRLCHRRPAVACRPGRRAGARRRGIGGTAQERGQGRHGPARCAGGAAPLPRPARWPAGRRAGPPRERDFSLVDRLRPRTVMVPFRYDQHPDHLAVHRARPLRSANAPMSASTILRLLPLPAARRTRHSPLRGAGALCRRRHGTRADAQAAGARLLPQPGHLPLPLAAATVPDARRCSTTTATGSSNSSPPRRTSPIARSSPQIRCACVSTYAMGPAQCLGRSDCSARIAVVSRQSSGQLLGSNSAGGARRNAGQRSSHSRSPCLRQVRHQRGHRARGHPTA